MRAIAIALALVAVVATAHAGQPATADALRDGNLAATRGEWARVVELVAPLLAGELAPADLAEAHRLAGLAAFFQQRTAEAESHFLAYLRLDLEGRLDPALYPPEVVGFFDDVRVRHAAELRARRPQPSRYFILTLLPPIGQWQNGQHTKAVVLGSVFTLLAISDVTTYFVLRSWCTPLSGSPGSSVTCDNTKDHSHAAEVLRSINIASSLGLIAAYAYGIYDGVHWYRRQSTQPFLAPVDGGGVVGVTGAF